jgi:2-polyprenyl-3-methyl-5-hydroxy-6-metoxy-1,4-benzoquinol methylase
VKRISRKRSIRLESQDSIREYYEEQYYGERLEGITGRSLKRVRSNLRGMLIRRGARFIDIGCGLGTTGSYLATRGAIPLGIDISFEAAQIALQSGGYEAAIQANAERLPFADLSFDGATFMGTLEHFINPSEALHEVNRVLKPDTQICFVVPNSNFFLFKFLGGTGQLHETPRTYEGWCRLFEEAGLRVEVVYRDIGPDIFEGGLLRGILRKLVLFAFNLLPVRYTYQFVSVCRR